MSNTTQAAPAAPAPAPAASQPTTTPPSGGVWAWVGGQWVPDGAAPAPAAAAAEAAE